MYRTSRASPRANARWRRRSSALVRFLHHAAEFAAFVQFERDVAAADQFAVDEKLRERRPVREARKRRTDFWIFQNIDRREIRADRFQRLRGAAGKSAHRKLRRA